MSGLLSRDEETAVEPAIHNPQSTIHAFLANLDRLCDGPDAIPRLRRFILDLAVQGKLVDQDPNDEPALELLERIKEENGLFSFEKQTEGKSPPWSVAEAEPPFPLPKGWEWSYLGDVIYLLSGQHLQPDEYSTSELDGPPYITGPADFGTDGLDITRYAKVGKAIAQQGQILLTVKGAGVGKTAVCDLPLVAISRQLMAMTPLQWSEGFLLITTHRLAEALKESARSLIPGISRGDVDNFLFALPPVAEQHRIVAKVDELMTLCDRLEAAQAERERRRERLNAASLARLNAPTADPETFRADAAFHLTHLPRFTTRPETIPQLRQTIRKLAIRGKIIKQNPANESVLDFLGEIKDFARSSRRSARHDRLADLQISPQSLPYDIPSSWACLPFGDVVLSRDGERIPVSKEERNGRAKLYDYYGASGVIDQIDGYLFDRPLLLIGEDGANLINRSTPIAFIARGQYWVNNHAHVLDGPSEEFLRYIELYINAIDLKPFVTGTAQPKMNQAKMNSIPVALPPFPEQRRIVAKVDELMALCDRLEAGLAATQTESRRLLDTLLHAALTATETSVDFDALSSVDSRK